MSLFKICDSTKATKMNKRTITKDCGFLVACVLGFLIAFCHNKISVHAKESWDPKMFTKIDSMLFPKGSEFKGVEF